MAAVSNGTTTGGPKTQNRSIHFLCRSRLANKEAVSLSIVRYKSPCLHFRRTTGHTVSIRNVERSRHILRMPFVIQGACPLLIPFILSDAGQVPISPCLGGAQSIAYRNVALAHKCAMVAGGQDHVG